MWVPHAPHAPLAPQPVAPTVLTTEAWRAREAAHIERANRLTAGHRARRQTGEKHPIEDFLFTYYNLKPAQLRRWHPGAGVVLEGVQGDEARSEWRDYVVTPEPAADPREPSPVAPHARAASPQAEAASLTVDAAAFLARRGATVDYVDDLMRRTMERPPSFGCFGLHEWAMVYRLSPEEIRHRGLPLRLDPAATDLVVETNPIACTHYDAYRFFTPPAAPLNTITPTRETQPELEQAGCLHAGMDVYKWAMKLGPLVPGELLLDAFELAMQIRVVDMQASPYDVSSFGLPAVAIETPEGKSEYARLQRGFMQRGNVLRERVLAAIHRARVFAEH